MLDTSRSFDSNSNSLTRRERRNVDTSLTLPIFELTTTNPASSNGLSTFVIHNIRGETERR
jgi:hypothetical protein